MMRKRAMSLNRKKLKEKIAQLEQVNQALLVGMQVLGIVGAMQMDTMRAHYIAQLANAPFPEGGVVPGGCAVGLHNEEGFNLNKEQEKKLRDKLCEYIGGESQKERSG